MENTHNGNSFLQIDSGSQNKRYYFSQISVLQPGIAFYESAFSKIVFLSSLLKGNIVPHVVC